MRAGQNQTGSRDPRWNCRTSRSTKCAERTPRGPHRCPHCGHEADARPPECQADAPAARRAYPVRSPAPAARPRWGKRADSHRHRSRQPAGSRHCPPGETRGQCASVSLGLFGQATRLPGSRVRWKRLMHGAGRSASAKPPAFPRSVPSGCSAAAHRGASDKPDDFTHEADMRRTGGAFRRQILFERRLRQVAHPAEQIQPRKPPFRRRPATCSARLLDLKG